MKVWEWCLLIVGVFAIYIVYTMQQNSTPAASTVTGPLGGVESAILNALSSFENVAASHNNPGGICGSYNADGTCAGPKTFASLEEGTLAALANVDRYLNLSPGMTVAQFVQKWSGASGATLTAYTQHVADSLGLGINDPITNAAGSAETADNIEPTGDSSFSDPEFGSAVSA
jgi:hypothetical protein